MDAPTTTNKPKRAYKKRIPRSDRGKKHNHTLPDALKERLWEKGKTPYAGGKKTFKKTFTKAFLDDFGADWREHGIEAIRRCREEDPVNYVKIAAGLLPKVIQVDNGTDQIDKRLSEVSADVISGLLSAIGDIKRSRLIDISPTSQEAADED